MVSYWRNDVGTAALLLQCENIAAYRTLEIIRLALSHHLVQLLLRNMPSIAGYFHERFTLYKFIFRKIVFA